MGEREEGERERERWRRAGGGGSQRKNGSGSLYLRTGWSVCHSSELTRTIRTVKTIIVLGAGETSVCLSVSLSVCLSVVCLCLSLSPYSFMPIYVYK